jgi:hypothetical protein
VARAEHGPRAAARTEPDLSAVSVGSTLAWRVWPARERPLAAVILAASCAILGILVRRATGDAVLGVAAPVFLLGSLSAFLFPTEYRLTEEAIEVRSLGVTRSRPWTEMRRMTVDATGVFLSPFEKRNWLEAYRGLRLLFGGNRDQVVSFAEARIGRRGSGS